MGTIGARKRADSSIAYLAKIVIKRQDEVVYRENQTFDRQHVASAWIAKRETGSANPARRSRP
ncbi:hypothetical protein GCM10019059_28980 [Camelimonas fluminis]|uniref:Uncharacterized protein n=1 Tax=Camelimonas fluminis TaxID=1576911 RepID=A0ABV7UFG9_9HYPH|nr:hypothetical protein [Camelimonas fluminis]GHE67389.1 hypothetical protein GCM10019059_28980 [Camelimonas fluminis]